MGFGKFYLKIMSEMEIQIQLITLWSNLNFMNPFILLK